MMKKILPVILILALMLSMTSYAFGLDLPYNGQYEVHGSQDNKNIDATLTDNPNSATVIVTGGNGEDGGDKTAGQSGGRAWLDVNDNLYMNGNIYVTGGNGGDGGTGGSSGGIGGTAAVEVHKGATVAGGIYTTGGDGGACSNVIGDNKAGAGGSSEVILRDRSTVEGDITVTGGNSAPGAADIVSQNDPDFGVNLHAGVIAVPGAKVKSHINVTGSSSGGKGGDAEVFVLFPVTPSEQPSQMENTYFNDINVTGGYGGTAGGKATGLDIQKDGTTVIAENISAAGGGAANSADGGTATGLKITGNNVTVLADGNISASGGGAAGKPSDSVSGEGYALELVGSNSTVIVTGDMSGSSATIKVQNVDDAMANSKIIVNSFDIEGDPSKSIVDGSGSGLNSLGAFVEKVFRYIVSWTASGGDGSGVKADGLDSLELDGTHSYLYAPEGKTITFSSADYNISVVEDGKYTKDNGGITDNGDGTVSVTVKTGGWLNNLKLSLTKKNAVPSSGTTNDSTISFAVIPVLKVKMSFNEKMYEVVKDQSLSASATVSVGADIIKNNLSRVKVLVDGKEIDSKHFELKMDGSTLSAEIFWDYLSTLSAGSHTISFSYDASGCDAVLLK